MKIRTKFFLLCLVVFLVPSTLFFLLYYRSASKAVFGVIQESYHNRLQTIAAYNEAVFDDLEESALDLAAKISLSSVNRLTGNADILLNESKAQIFRNIRDMLINTASQSYLIDSVYYFSTRDHWFISDKSAGLFSQDAVADTEWARDLAAERNNYWTVQSRVFNSDGNVALSRQKDLLTYYIYVVGYDGHYIGAVALNLSIHKIGNLMGDMLTDPETRLALLDARGDPLYLSTDEEDFHQVEHSPEYFVVMEPTLHQGWNYEAVLPMGLITRQLTSLKTLFATFLGLMLLVLLVLSMLCSRYLSEPLGRLLTGMRKVEAGDLSTKIQAQRKDELGQIFVGFNAMTKALQESQLEIYTQKLLKKDIQLKMMFSQLNAHFLYNTLDILCWMGKVRHNPDVAELAMALAQYFRINLSEGRDLVTVREIIALIENYLQIYSIKSDYQVRLDVQIPPGHENDLVLKYLFQPIVENCVQHGLEPKGSDGVIRLTMKTKGSSVVFTVTDDGVGMDREKLLEMRRQLRQDPNNEVGNFALKNINTQIKLFYGENYGLDIISRRGVGTRVRLRLHTLNACDTSTGEEMQNTSSV